MFFVSVFDYVSFDHMGCLEFLSEPSACQILSGIQVHLMCPRKLAAEFCAWGRVFAFMLDQLRDEMFTDHPLVILVRSTPIAEPTFDLICAIERMATFSPHPLGCKGRVKDFSSGINWRHLAQACDPLFVLRRSLCRQFSDRALEIIPKLLFYLRPAFRNLTVSECPDSVPSCSMLDSPWLHEMTLTRDTKLVTSMTVPTSMDSLTATMMYP